jgi:PAS domain-containing protein
VVLEADVKLLMNPILMRAGLVFIVAGFAFVLAIVVIRKMRRGLTDVQSEIEEGTTSLDQLPLHTYHAVIQQLKQQKHELTAQHQMERRLAKATENISAAVLSHLSSGVVFFNTAGMVRQANRAAKSILGYASPIGMSAKEIFRDATHDAVAGRGTSALSEAVMEALKDGTVLSGARTEYRTPANEERTIEVTMSPVMGPDNKLLGAACLFTDNTAAAAIERRIQMRGDLSAEMALALRTSLVTISGYAQQLAKNRDPDMAQQLATDIAQEAAQLDHTIGGFLAEAKAAAAAGHKS